MSNYCTIYVNATLFTLYTSQGAALKGPFAESEQDQQNVSWCRYLVDKIYLHVSYINYKIKYKGCVYIHFKIIKCKNVKNIRKL